MMKVIIFTCLLATVYGQGGAQINGTLMEAASRAFNTFDHNKDGIVALNEFEGIIANEDTDNDNCVTQTEYSNGSPAPLLFSRTMFTQFNKDGDRCLTVTDMDKAYNSIDKNDNGQMELQEFQDFMKSVFPNFDSLVGR